MSTLNTNEPSSLVQALSLDDLPVYGMHSAQNNAALAWCSRRHFSVGGVDLQFEPVAQVIFPESAALWMQLDFAGTSCVLALSPEWASALIQNDGWTLDSLDDLSLDMWCRVRWAPLFPSGLLLTQSSFKIESLASITLDGMVQSSWVGRHVSSRELSGHMIHLWTPEHFPVTALAELVGAKAKTILSSPLLNLPITLPIVAARWCVDADDLIDLAVGDLLLVG
jgi:hypothetical protein